MNLSTSDLLVLGGVLARCLASGAGVELVDATFRQGGFDLEARLQLTDEEAAVVARAVAK